MAARQKKKKLLSRFENAVTGAGSSVVRQSEMDAIRGAVSKMGTPVSGEPRMGIVHSRRTAGEDFRREQAVRKRAAAARKKKKRTRKR